jgi:hypothetical protein
LNPVGDFERATDAKGDDVLAKASKPVFLGVEGGSWLSEDDELEASPLSSGDCDAKVGVGDLRLNEDVDAPLEEKIFFPFSDAKGELVDA